MITTKPKILALTAFRDEARFLNDFLNHLASWVDGILCYDDCSQDESYAIAKKHPSVLMTGRRAPRMGVHEMECQNRFILLTEAYKLGAEFVLCLDPDERMEKNFLRDLPKLVHRHKKSVVWVKVRDLWNNCDQYRVDGVWATKTKPVLMPCIEPLNYPLSGLHTRWTPPALDDPQHQVYIFYNLYHLRSILPADRAERVAKFKRIDPLKREQAIGYDYLADETGLKLELVPPDRRW